MALRVLCFTHKENDNERTPRDWWLPLGVGRLAVILARMGPVKSLEVLENSLMQTNNNELFARSIRFDLANGKSNDFHTLFRNEVLPMLKKQEGFKDELLLVNDDRVIAISIWNNADAAKKYETTTYPMVDQKLRPMMSGAPTVETFKYDSLSTIS